MENLLVMTVRVSVCRVRLYPKLSIEDIELINVAVAKSKMAQFTRSLAHDLTNICIDNEIQNDSRFLGASFLLLIAPCRCEIYLFLRSIELNTGFTTTYIVQCEYM